MIEVEAQQFGNHTLRAEARAVLGEEGTLLERSALVRVEGARPVARYLLSGSAGQQRLRLDVVNPGARHTYRRVEVTVQSELPLGSVEELFAELVPGAAHRIFDIPVTPGRAASPVTATIRSVGPTGQSFADRFLYYLPAAVAAAPVVLPDEGHEAAAANVSPAADDVRFVEVPAVQQPRSRALVAVASLLAVILALLFIGRRLQSHRE